MSADGLKSKKGTSTFSSKSGNVMMKCEGVANRYIHFVHPLDTRCGNRIRKELSPTRKVDNHFLRLGVV